MSRYELHEIGKVDGIYIYSLTCDGVEITRDNYIQAVEVELRGRIAEGDTYQEFSKNCDPSPVLNYEYMVESFEKTDRFDTEEANDKDG